MHRRVEVSDTLRGGRVGLLGAELLLITIALTQLAQVANLVGRSFHDFAIADGLYRHFTRAVHLLLILLERLNMLLVAHHEPVQL